MTEALPQPESNPNPSPTESIDDDEMLARFVFFSDYFRRSGQVRPEAFNPEPYSDLSVFRHVGLGELGIWQGCKETSVKRNKMPKGRADIVTGIVRATGLTVRPDEPPKNHAVILAFALQVSERDTQLKELAANARFVDLPSGFSFQ